MIAPVAGRSVVAVLVAAAALVACGDDDEPAAPTTTSATTATTTTTTATTTATTATTTATTLPTTGDVVLESALYRYAVTLPVDRLTPVRPFQPATVAWDGRSGITRDQPVLDRLLLRDGVVFLLGAEWADDVESLADHFSDLQAERNGCADGHDHREVTVGATPARAYVQDLCGPTDDEGFIRVAVVHDGFGLIAFASTQPDQWDASIDLIVTALANLEFRDS